MNTLDVEQWYIQKKTSNTYNISSSVENEVLKREERLRKLKWKRRYRNRKEKIENALTCLNDIEMEFLIFL